MVHKIISLIRMHIIVAGLTALMLCSSVGIGTHVAQAAEGRDTESRIAELTAKIAVLQSMLQKLLANAGASSTAETGEIKGLLIPLGTTVTLSAGIQVRSDAGGRDTLLGVKATGTTGTVIAGPVRANGGIWYQMDFATGIDGWCRAAGLLTNTNVKELLPRPVPMGTSTLRTEIKGLMEMQAKIDYLRQKLASSTNIAEQTQINNLISKLLQNQSSGTTQLKPKKATSTEELLRKPRASSTPLFRPRATSTKDRLKVPALTGTTTETGVVLGASTDVLSEIGVTLNTISTLLRTGVSN